MSDAVPPISLAQLMELEVTPRRLWQTQELGAVLQHQLSAPMGVELGRLRLGIARSDDSAVGHRLAMMSFGDLLHNPNPPLEVLELVKAYAKASAADADSPLPSEVARVLYYGSILIARWRCGQRITSLSDATIDEGARWLLDRPWVPEELKTLLRSAMKETGEPDDRKVPPDDIRNQNDESDSSAR